MSAKGISLHKVENGKFVKYKIKANRFGLIRGYRGRKLVAMFGRNQDMAINWLHSLNSK